MTLPPKRCKPHVVILGAGASLAALPNGGKKGRKLSAMDNFFENLGYDIGLSLSQSRNLENIYRNADQERREEVEYIIETHFHKLNIPDELTIYDQLLLGLRPKDLIASFNWDPLLIQAYNRNKEGFNLPQIVFLHGNISAYYCPKHYKYNAFRGGLCPKCKSRLINSNLLYPIEKKDYNKTPFLTHQWKVFKDHFRITPLVTIFGYSAPSTDVEARKILKDVWGTPNKRKLEEIEFIDTKQKDQLREEWKEFIYSHHFRNYSSFYESYIGMFPRRSIEACNREILLGEVLDYKPAPHFTSLQELRDYMRPLQEEETIEKVNSIKKWKKICP